MESQKDPETITKKYLTDIFLSFVIAGRLHCCHHVMLHLHDAQKHPPNQDKLFKKAVDKQRVGIDPIDDSEEFTDTIIDKMHYLHAAIT